jgi:hypothetical protein
MRKEYDLKKMKLEDNRYVKSLRKVSQFDSMPMLLIISKS